MHDVQALSEAFREIVCHLSLALLLGMVAAIAIAWMAKTVAAPMRRLLDGGIVRMVLAVAMVGTGIVESFSKHTNDPPRSVPSPLPDVTLEDISNGWRVAATREGNTLSRPQDGAYTIHEPWLVRGGFGDVTRISAVGWSFPWRDGFADGLTVCSDGDIRLDLRTSYFPRPLGVPLAVVPAFNWHLLPGGVSNVFWHAATPSNSLVVAWENAPVNRDASCLTNFQAEFFADGRFAYRHPDREVEYAPVFPFDWDGDGLENSVDPDPLVVGPDAHGTNAEWYNTVCSNVFYAVATSCDPPGMGGNPDAGGAQLVASVELSWREGVNSNAYYFVDIVAEKGPVPISFTGDRASRLGDPVVVALAGETNRVPLLVGIDYAVTSTVPFTVSFPMDYMYPEVETNEPCVARICWPLEFSVMPDGNGYRVVAAPYDPGCEFQWPTPTRSVTCGYTTSGGWIGFDCGNDGNCGCDGCSVTGFATLENAEFEIPSIWCGCCNDGPADLGSGPGVPQTNGPSVSVSFDKSVVFYEDAYTNAPGDVVAKHSTKTTLSVSASAGEDGGMLYVTAENIGKLVRTGGNAITFPYTAYVPPNGGASFAIEYEAAEHSDSINDISVTATLQSAGMGGAVGDSSSVTTVKIWTETNVSMPRYRQRKILGVGESVKISHSPGGVSLRPWCNCGIITASSVSEHMYKAASAACTDTIVMSNGEDSYDFSFSIIAPTGFHVLSLSCGADGLHSVGNFSGYIRHVATPTNVSFAALQFIELGRVAQDATGYFTNSILANWLDHSLHGADVWTPVDDNTGEFFDTVTMPELPPPWGEGGHFTWPIPNAWRCGTAAGVTNEFCSTDQRFELDADCTTRILKMGCIIERTTNYFFNLTEPSYP